MTNQERMEKLAREYVESVSVPNDDGIESYERLAFLAGYQAALAEREAVPVDNEAMQVLRAIVATAADAGHECYQVQQAKRYLSEVKRARVAGKGEGK